MDPMKSGARSPGLKALGVSFGYAAVAGLYIWVSDAGLESLVNDAQRALRLGTLKGWGFVAVTAVALFVLLRRLEYSTRQAAESEAEHRRLRDAERQRMEVRYRSLVERIPAILYEASCEAGRRIRFISPQVEHGLGFSVDDWMEEPEFWRQRIHPGDRSWVTALFDQAVGAGQPFLAEYRLVGQDESVRWVQDRAVVTDGDGMARYVQGIMVDVTDRKAAEDALRESQRILSTLVSNLPGMVYRCLNDPGWTMEYVSDGCLELTGYPVSDLERYGRVSYGQIIHPDDRDRVWREVQMGVVYDRPFRLEYRIVTLGGEEKWVWEQGRRVVGDDGAVVALEGFITDITARRQLEEQLRQAQKMEALGRLAGGMAHDFNNVMQAVLALTPWLAQIRGDPDRHQEGLRELEQQVSRASGLSRQLLLFARGQRARLFRVDLNEIVRDSTALLRRLIRENIRFDLETLDERLFVDADPVQIEQVLMNLVLNGVDAMPSGGRLLLRTGRDDGQAWIEVRDTGHGIPAAIRDKVFEPFFSTKDAEHGTGLGLTVTRSIVSSHGGTMELDSREGDGTSFRVALPLRAALPCGSSPVAAPDEGFEPSGRGERLLLVEDQTDVRRGLREALSLLGYRVVAAATAEEALEMPAEPAFDLLLTDTILPGRSGCELMGELSARWPRMGVVIMSGDGPSGPPEPAKSPCRYLDKPFNLATLAREIRSMLDSTG